MYFLYIHASDLGSDERLVLGEEFSQIAEYKVTQYWRPTSSSNGAELTLNVYSSGELQDVIKVIIKPNDSCTGYVALMTKN